MKFRHQVGLYAGGAGATTLIAILLSVREQLIAVGPWVLDTMLAAAASALIYGGIRVYVSGRKHWLTLQEQKQQFLHEGKRQELELLGMQVKIYTDWTRMAADQNGNYPVLLPPAFVSPADIGGNVLMLPPGQVRPAGQRLLGDGKQPVVDEPLQVPVKAAFRDVIDYIQPEVVVCGKVKREAQVVLAMDHEGAVLGEILDWLSTLVVGMPGMGKSTALYFFIAQLMMLTARFQVLDPHASLISLKDLLPYINRTDGCIQCAPLIEDELERRMDRYEENDGVCLDQHYMLIVDELPAIADREQQLAKAKRLDRSLIDVLRRVVCEGRKYKMYCMVVGQSIPATILPTIARDNMSSRYVFNCSASHARMAGLDGRTIEAFLPQLEKSKGRCIVAPARMKPFIGAIPMTDVNDLRYVIEQIGYQREGWDDAAEAESTAITEEMPALPSMPHLWVVPGEDERDTDEIEEIDDEVARGVQAYQDGARTIDEFQAAMGLQTQHQARGLLARVKQAIREGA